MANGAQRWDEHPLDVDAEDFAIDRAVDDHRRRDPVEPEPGDEGGGAPVAVRQARPQALAARSAAAEAGHLRVQPGFVDEYEPLGVELRLAGEPGEARFRDIGALLLGRVPGLFLAILYLPYPAGRR